MSPPSGKQRFARGVGLAAGLLVAVAVVASSATAIVYHLSRRPSAQVLPPALAKPTQDELRAERAQLAEEMKRELEDHPFRPGRHPLDVLAESQRRRQIINRMRAVCVQLGDPVDGLDDLLRHQDEIDDLARRKLRGEQ
jgi:hypothetical protein